MVKKICGYPIAYPDRQQIYTPAIAMATCSGKLLLISSENLGAIDRVSLLTDRTGLAKNVRHFDQPSDCCSDCLRFGLTLF